MEFLQTSQTVLFEFSFTPVAGSLKYAYVPHVALIPSYPIQSCAKVPQLTLFICAYLECTTIPRAQMVNQLQTGKFVDKIYVALMLWSSCSFAECAFFVKQSYLQ
jgi:hypothetical protein